MEKVKGSAVSLEPSCDWYKALAGEFEKPYFQELQAFLDQEYASQEVFPGADEVFNALYYTPLSGVRVLILGQDPYHDTGQAHGLAFSVPQAQVKLPPSLKNIYKELHEDLGCEIPRKGYLKKWADQGVLLLNTVLTVRAHQANSHKGRGWETFTDAVIECVNGQDRPLVIVLWGSHAQKKVALLNNPNHHIISGPHPSPLSAYRGFFGSKPFSQANKFLKENGIKEVDWCL